MTTDAHESVHRHLAWRAELHERDGLPMPVVLNAEEGLMAEVCEKCGEQLAVIKVSNLGETIQVAETFTHGHQSAFSAPRTDWQPGDRVIVQNGAGPDVTGTVVDPETFPVFVNLRAEDPAEYHRVVEMYALFIDVGSGTMLRPAPGGRVRWRSPEAHLHDHHGPKGYLLNIRPDQLDRVRAEPPPSPFHRN